MGLFSEFMEDYRRAQQESKAVRGVARPTEQQLSAVTGRAATRATAETRGGIAEAERGQSLEDLAAVGKRFTAGLGMERKRSLLARESREAELALEAGRLGLEERTIKKGKQVWPWAFGLRAGELVGTHFEAGAEQKRQAAHDKLLREILQPRRRPIDYGGTVPGRGDFLLQ